MLRDPLLCSSYTRADPRHILRFGFQPVIAILAVRNFGGVSVEELAGLWSIVVISGFANDAPAVGPITFPEDCVCATEQLACVAEAFSWLLDLIEKDDQG